MFKSALIVHAMPCHVSVWPGYAMLAACCLPGAASYWPRAGTRQARPWLSVSRRLGTQGFGLVRVVPKFGFVGLGGFNGFGLVYVVCLWFDLESGTGQGALWPGFQ